MIRRLTLFICLGLLAGFPVLTQADHHEPPPDSPPKLILQPPEGTEKPEDVEMSEDPEEAKAQVVEIMFGMMDADGNGELNLDELRGWVHDVWMPALPPEGEPPPEGEHMGVSEGDEGLEGKPHPPECTDELFTNEMEPQAEGETCAETEGNLVFRTVCNVEGFNAQAITLPEGRAAGCFDIEAIRGSNIVFEIVRESDGAVEFDTSMGKDAFHTLVLVGPEVYHLKLVSGSPDAAITVRFIDHGVF
jgi:hypothetical protein